MSFVRGRNKVRLDTKEARYLVEQILCLRRDYEQIVCSIQEIQETLTKIYTKEEINILLGQLGISPDGTNVYTLELESEENALVYLLGNGEPVSTVDLNFLTHDELDYVEIYEQSLNQEP